MEFQTLQLEFCLATAQQYLCHAFEDHPGIAILVQAAVDHVFHLGKRLKNDGASEVPYDSWGMKMDDNFHI